MEQLKSWMAALSKCLFNIFPQMEPGVFDKMKQKIITHVKTYEEPQIDEHGKLIRKGRKVEKKNDKEEDDGSEDSEIEDVRVEMPLPPGVLKVNLGIPVIVVCNKIDLLQASGEKSKFLEEHLDFIQKHVREYSLQYGATVLFTSAKSNQDRNLDTLYQYMLSRLYDFDFYGKPQQLEKDQLFIPSGFDSLNLINELCKGTMLTQASDGTELSYEDVVRP